jgi:hypothetical protein
MSVNMSDDKNIPTNTEAYYEKVVSHEEMYRQEKFASQEEKYREETEEELRAILMFEEPAPLRIETDMKDNQGINEQRDCAAEELITGDSDDPPLSEHQVAELLGKNEQVIEKKDL